MNTGNLSRSPVHRPAPSPDVLATFVDPADAAKATARIARGIVPANEIFSVSMAHHLAVSLGNCFRVYADEHQRFQREFSEDSVHELRVASRRLIAQLDLLASVISRPTIEKGRRVLKRAVKTLGRLRDSQVQRLFVEDQLQTFPDLILVRDYLMRSEKRLAREVAAKVNALKLQKLEKWINAMLQELAERTSQTRLRFAVIGVAEQAQREATRRARAAVGGDPATIHRTRVAFKKFRYMMETLSPEVNGFGQQQFQVLANCQRKMGIVQDLEIVRACVIEFKEKYKASESLLTPFCRHLDQCRTRAASAFLKCVDQLLELPPVISSHGSLVRSAA